MGFLLNGKDYVGVWALESKFIKQDRLLFIAIYRKGTENQWFSTCMYSIHFIIF